MLSANRISYRVGAKTLLAQTTVLFAPGKLHVIMGPNGAGKSTLLQLLAGERTPATGSVSWKEKALPAYSRLELARERAVLSQQYSLQFPVTVREVVRLGRFPHAGILSLNAEEQVVSDCLAQLKMTSFSERDYGTLSGGEAQKVQMSRVLAQLGGLSANGKLLLLDEPVSHLDVRYQHLLLQTARELALKGNTVIAVLHDLNLAIRFGHRLLLLKDGAVRYDIPHAHQLTEAIIRDVFDLPVRLLNDNGQPVVVF